MAELHENLLGETVSTPIGGGRVAAITKDEQGFQLLVELNGTSELSAFCIGGQEDEPSVRVQRPRKMAIQFGVHEGRWYAWSLRPFTLVGPQSTMASALVHLARELDPQNAPSLGEDHPMAAALWLAAHASVRFIGAIPDKLLATFNAPST